MFLLFYDPFLFRVYFFGEDPSYALLRETSDRLCKEHNLSVIENPKKSRSKSYDALMAERSGSQTWWSIVRSDVDNSIKQSISINAFYRHMESLGYEIKFGKHVAVRPQGKERFVRLKTLGENYTEDAIKQRILAQSRPKPPKRTQKEPPKRVKISCSFDDLFLRKITFNGIRALYFRFLNLLKKAKKQTEYEIPFVLKEDLRKLDEISRQTVLLMKNNIEINEQLEEFIADKETDIEKLYRERKILNSKIYRLPKESVDKVRVKRDSLSNRISKLRKELKSAKGIAKRK